MQLGTPPITKQRFIIDPAYTYTGNREEEEEEAIKKKVAGQQRRSTRSLRWRAALVIWPANNNRSGRPPVRFGAVASSHTDLCRSLHSNKDRPLAPSCGSRGGQPQSAVRSEDGERREPERAKEKEVDADRSGGERRAERRPPLGTRQMRRGTREVRGKSENLAGERENGRKYRVGRRYAARCSSSRRCESTRSSLCLRALRFPPPFLIGSFLRPAGLLFRAPTAPNPP